MVSVAQQHIQKHQHIMCKQVKSDTFSSSRKKLVVHCMIYIYIYIYREREREGEREREKDVCVKHSSEIVYILDENEKSE